MTSSPDSTRRRPRPTGIERRFDADELFYSTTDRKGVITSGNDVFARVAAYSIDEMIGRPHNLIRHPDMPRGAFRLLWDYLDAGRPAAAYVKNLAADGGHYWVLAYVAPTEDGFLSIRLKPGSDLFDATRGIYERVRQYELEHEHDTVGRKAMIERSRDLLMELVAAAGFDTYDAFMQAALPAEVALFAAANDQAYERSANATSSQCIEAEAQLKQVVEQLGSWAEATDHLSAHATMMVELADDIELFSMNAQIASTRLGDDGRALLAVAGLLTRQSTQLRPLIQRQVDEVAAAASLLGGAGEVAFAAAVSRLQVAMLRAFLEAEAQGEDAVAAERMLAGALATGVGGLVRAVDQLSELLQVIDEHARLVSRGMGQLRSLEVNGRIEATRVDRAADLARMFVDIGDHVRAGLAAIEEIDVTRIAGTDAAHRAQRVVEALRSASDHGVASAA